MAIHPTAEVVGVLATSNKTVFIITHEGGSCNNSVAIEALQSLWGKNNINLVKNKETGIAHKAAITIKYTFSE